MKLFCSIKKGLDKRIIGLVNFDGGIVKNIDFDEYDISMIVQEGIILEILFEKKEESK